MADYTDNALLASIKALEKVVYPAVDPEDPLAGEQLRLVVGFLKFLRMRLPHWQLRQLFELNFYLALADDLATDAQTASSALSTQLSVGTEKARALLQNEAPPIEEIRAATACLTTPISALARAVATAEPDLRRRVEHRILARSKQWVDMQRSWFTPQGFELRPAELPSLDSLFRVPRA